MNFIVKVSTPETTDEIVDYLKANGFLYVHWWINQENFPLTAKGAPKEDEVVIYDPGIDPGISFTEEEGLAILRREGLLRPTYEHALRFAREHGTTENFPENVFVSFLHEPWKEPRGDWRIIEGVFSSPERSLGLGYPDVPRGMRIKRILAGVRPR